MMNFIRLVYHTIQGRLSYASRTIIRWCLSYALYIIRLKDDRHTSTVRSYVYVQPTGCLYIRSKDVHTIILNQSCPLCPYIRLKGVHTIKGCLYDINSLHSGVHASNGLSHDNCSIMHAIDYVLASALLTFV